MCLGWPPPLSLRSSMGKRPLSRYPISNIRDINPETLGWELRSPCRGIYSYLGGSLLDGVMEGWKPGKEGSVLNSIEEGVYYVHRVVWATRFRRNGCLWRSRDGGRESHEMLGVR